MTRHYELKADQTLETLTGLLDSGITRIALILRHSARFFHRDARMEPFMGLTDEGKTFALELGSSLPEQPVPALFSSSFGRCIETAYLVDKGYTRTHGHVLPPITSNDMLAPFYIKDIEKAVTLVDAQGTGPFIRNWFDRAIDPDVMEDPEKTADMLCKFMVDRLEGLKENQMAVCISHDWNIFPLKEYKLGLRHETAGDVGYLEGVAVYENDNGQPFITCFQGSPIAL